MAPLKFSTELREKIPRAGDVTTYRFDKPAGYEYRAGQWGAIDIASDGRTLSHHFTHASSPTEPFLDITTHVRKSDFKQALDGLALGTSVEMEGPFGSFTLRDDVGPVAFLTGGIGITPVRSILRWLADSGAGEDARQMVVLYGNETLGDAIYREELDRLNDELPFLEVLHVLNQPGEGWQGYTGYIDGEILEDALRSLSGWTYYLSGPPAMVAALQDTLRGEAVARDAIIAEDFTGYE